MTGGGSLDSSDPPDRQANVDLSVFGKFEKMCPRREDNICITKYKPTDSSSRQTSVSLVRVSKS